MMIETEQEHGKRCHVCHRWLELPEEMQDVSYPPTGRKYTICAFNPQRMLDCSDILVRQIAIEQKRLESVGA